MTLIGKSYRKASDKIEYHKVARRSYYELSNLSNRELNDIGLSRGDIFSVAYGKTDDYNEKVIANANLKGYV